MTRRRIQRHRDRRQIRTTSIHGVNNIWIDHELLKYMQQLQRLSPGLFSRLCVYSAVVRLGIESVRLWPSVTYCIIYYLIAFVFIVLFFFFDSFSSPNSFSACWYAAGN